MKRITVPLIILTLSILLFSCSNLLQKELNTSGTDAEKATASNTVILTGSIEISGAFPKEIADSFKAFRYMAASGRTAFPSLPSGSEYYIELTDPINETILNDSETNHAAFFGEAGAELDEGTFMVPLEKDRHYNLTVALIEENDPSKKLLSDTRNDICITDDNPVYLDTFFLEPSITETGTGTVALPIYIEPTAFNGNAVINLAVRNVKNLTTGETLTATPFTFSERDTVNSIITLQGTDITSGAYSMQIDFLMQQGASPEIRMFTCKQTVNVYDSMTTDTWVNNGSTGYISEGKIKLTTQTIAASLPSVFYVNQEAAESGSGSYANPFKTFQEAVISATSATSSGKKVTIHINDGYTDSITKTFSNMPLNGHLTIECWKNTIGDGLGTATFTLTENIDANYSVFKIKNANAQVVLSGITLDGNGFGSENSTTGIDFQKGELTLNNCTIKNISTGGISMGGEAKSLTITGKTVITGNGTSGAISNVKLAAGKKITVGTLTSDSKIGVTLADEETEAGTVFTTGFKANNPSLLPSSIFTSDKADTGGNALPVGYGSADDAAKKEAALYTAGHFTITPDMGDGVRIILNKNAVAVNDNAANRTVTVSVIDIAGNRITPALDAHLLLAGDVVPTSASFASISGNAYTISPSLREGAYQFYVTAVYDGKTYASTFDFTVHNDATVPLATLTAPPTSGSYSLSSKEELTKIFEWSTDTAIHADFEDVTFDISEDIDITDFGGDWYPITTFKGTINGNGHTVSIPFSSNGGLVTTNDGVIENLVIDITGVIEANANYNFFAYTNTGIIRNCKTTGSVEVKTQYDIGPFAVINEGLIENCINEADLKYNKMANWADIYGSAAGIAAHNNPNGIISNCVNYGTIYAATTFLVSSATYNGRVGSIFISSKENSTVQNCYWLKNCAKYNVDNKDIYFNRIGCFGPLTQNSGSSTFNVDEVAGTNIGCGYFEGRTITAGTAAECETDQTLAYGTDLLIALNAYVDAHPEDNLKYWVMGADGHVTLEGLEE